MANFANDLNNFQVLPRELVFDSTLSDRARFVYCFMACKPSDWNFYLEPMSKEIGYSVDTLRKYINELVSSGWLKKGEQCNEGGVFGAVSYILQTTKNTDTVFFRHGKTPIQHNIDDKQIIECNKEKEERDKSLSQKKDEFFEECWLLYNRKGSKKKSFEQWKKLKEEEKEQAKKHIVAYVESVSDIRYQKDFERYLRDKVFNNVVFKDGKALFDVEATSKNNNDEKLVFNGIIYR